jgi:hypothetical protein
MLSMIERMHRVRDEIAARDSDPWMTRLQQLRGQLGNDGVERVTVQMALDVLEVPPRHRSSSAYRRLNRLLAELGWTPLRVRTLGAGGHKDRLRGFARYPIQPC